MICVIAGAMPEERILRPKDSFVIAADGGFAHLTAQGITPDWIVGDFDSLGFVPQGTQVVRHPVRKDDTDMVLAVREGLARGYKKFLLYGGLGGRLDHTIANLQTLALLVSNGARGVLYGSGTAVTLLENEHIHLPPKDSGDVSVFAFGGRAIGVTERGLSYSLTEGTMTPDNPMGVSNSFCGAEAEISVREGRLLLLWSATAEEAVSFLEKE